jgi:hypothetical protein
MLLILTRMLVSPAMLVRDPSAPQLDMGPLGVMTLAALKYGNSKYESFLQAEPIEPFQLSEVQAQDVRDIWELSAYCSYLAGLRLIVGDGWRIVADEERVSADRRGRPNALDLLHLRRVADNRSSFLSRSALFEEFPSPGSARELHIDHPRVLFALPLAKAGDLGSEPPTTLHSRRAAGIPDFPHYFLMHWDVHDVTQLLELGAEAIQEEYGISPTEFSVVLAAVTARTIHDINRLPACMATACRTGLSVFSYRNFLRSLEAGIELITQVLGIPEPSHTLRARALRGLLLSDSNYRNLDILYPSIRSIFYRFGNHVVVDWLLTADLLIRLVSLVSEDSSTKNVKGVLFEQRVGEYISETKPDAQMLFPPNKKLRRGGELFAEIDLSYRVGHTAFIIDCKAYQVAPECVRGDAGAVTTRWSYTERWLSRVVSVTRALADAPQGDNYSIPEDIRYLVPVVCSANVERIYSDDDLHLLAPGLSRICTPFELVGILGQDKLDLASNEYTFSINANPGDS